VVLTKASSCIENPGASRRLRRFSLAGRARARSASAGRGTRSRTLSTVHPAARYRIGSRTFIRSGAIGLVLFVAVLTEAYPSQGLVRPMPAGSPASLRPPQLGKALASSRPTSARVVESGVLSLGSTGPSVLTLQRRLQALGYRPGDLNGVFGATTASAVLAFQKREGISRTAVVGAAVQSALTHPTGQGPRSGLPVPRIEVDLSRQIVFVVLKGSPVITLNASTGSGKTYRAPGGRIDLAYTPVGTFKIIGKIAGDHVAALGTLRDPLYFYKGWAVHGSTSVPAYPASHGCVRISNADADWLFPLISLGTQVVVYDTTRSGVPTEKVPSDAAAGS
jgi:peptidoglycan hydrolase-like protein with peptidoglycan-binding domain